jgi:hypothetical protein
MNDFPYADQAANSLAAGLILAASEIWQRNRLRKFRREDIVLNRGGVLNSKNETQPVTVIGGQ